MNEEELTNAEKEEIELKQKEKSLSDKIEEIFNRCDVPHTIRSKIWRVNKEAVKKLKKAIIKRACNCDDCTNEIVDKIFGPKLVEKEK